MAIAQKVFSYGETKKKIEVDGFVVTETLHGPLASLHDHTHEYANVLLVVRGAFEERIAGREHQCGPGSVFLRPREERHANRYGREGATCLIVGVTPHRLERVSQFTSVLDKGIAIERGYASVLAARVYQELRRADSVSNLAIEGLLMELIAEATRQFMQTPDTASSPKWLARVREMLHAHFNESITLTHLSEVADMHPVHVARVFRAQYGCSIGDYVRRLRAERACEELADSNVSLSQIALDTGFSNQSHLSTAIKNFTGLTPTQYRRIVQG